MFPVFAKGLPMQTEKQNVMGLSFRKECQVMEHIWVMGEQKSGRRRFFLQASAFFHSLTRRVLLVLLLLN
jgi:hypothetical protein